MAPAAARSVREGRLVVDDKVADKLAARAEKARLAKAECDKAKVVAVVDVDKVSDRRKFHSRKTCVFQVFESGSQCISIPQGRGRRSSRSNGSCPFGLGQAKTQGYYGSPSPRGFGDWLLGQVCLCDCC